LTVGKTDQKELQSLIHVYESRLKHYISFEIIIIPDLKNTKSLSETLQKQREGQLILKNLIPTDILILLDEKGQTLIRLLFQITSKNICSVDASN